MKKIKEYLYALIINWIYGGLDQNCRILHRERRIKKTLQRKKIRSQIVHGIKTYKKKKKAKDPLLFLDIAEYDGKFKFHNTKYDLKTDILKATTIRDLEIIKGIDESRC